MGSASGGDENISNKKRRWPPFCLARTTNWLDGRVAKSSAKEKIEKRKKRSSSTLFQSPKRQIEYQGYRAIAPDRASSGSSIPVVIGAIIIAAAILLSTLVTAVGTRFVGMETSSEESLWLIDRLTGSVYKCQAPERGKASCEAEVATGSIAERAKH